MSKDRKKLLHIHSSVNDKQPTPATLELGELGVNNAKGNAFISTKNSEGEVVRFSEDETVIGWMEQKEVFPYEGYMRGADNSQVDGVTEQDLLDNKSNLIIKLNQVVPENTDYSPYDEKVNGAKDIYGNLINPISSGGYKDGAGLAIDMSKYAMIGANPSFSSITTTCHATLNGTTEIKGKGDGCGSKFTVEVANACIDATDTLNEYGVNHSNFGTSCDGTKISNDTTLKGKKILIDSPEGDTTVDIQACSHISGRTNDFVIRECQDNAGKVEIDSTTVKVSASTTDVKSCDRISALTNDFQVKECAANGKAGITSTTINNSATTITEEACNGISEVTNDFKVTECTDGQGTATIKSCKKFNVKSNDIVLEQCGNSGETKINSCKGISAVTDNFIVEQCSSGKTHIRSCAGITLESKNITLTDGNCGSGQTTIEVNDLCLVGERKINIYGDETNVGLDCGDNTIATNTRVFGNAICVNATDRASMYGANKSDLGINCADNGRSTLTRVSGDTVNEGGNIVNTNAETSINETAPTINETATTSINEKAPAITESASTSISETAPNITETATGKIVNTATGNVETTSVNAKITENAKTNIEETAGTDITETAGHDITETASHDINNTATNDIYVTAGNKLCEKGKDSYFYGTNSTTIGKGCDDTLSSNITYWRNAEPVCDNGVVGFSATTVDGALDEVYYRSQVSMTSTGNTTGIDVPVPETGTSIVRSGSTTYTIHQDSDGCDKTYDFVVDNTIVSMSAYTYPAESELLKKYTLWQYIGDDRVEIGEINVPKDHLIEDVQIVYGQVTGDPSSETGQTFVTCSTVSQDCHWYIKMVWHTYRSETGEHVDKVTYLPADDFVTDIDDKNDKADRGVKVDVWYDGKQNWVSADTTVKIMSYDGASARTFSKSAAVHTLTAYTLNSVSGDVKTANAATNWTYDPFDKKVTITAATDASHINRKTVSWSYGDVKSASGASYDPGDGTVNTFGNTRTMSFVIPQSVDDINRGTLNVTHNGVTYEYDPASASTWTLEHKALTINYGITCSNSDAVNKTYDTSAAETIVIPKTIDDITGGAIKLNECSGNCITVSGDTCVNGVVKANALYSTSDERLKENVFGIRYEDYHKASEVNLKSFNFKDDETKTKTYGVIAQHLQGAGLGNIVHEDDKGNLSVDYISFLILRIADLENTVRHLSEKIKEVEDNKR